MAILRTIDTILKAVFLIGFILVLADTISGGTWFSQLVTDLAYLSAGLLLLPLFLVLDSLDALTGPIVNYGILTVDFNAFFEVVTAYFTLFMEGLIVFGSWITASVPTIIWNLLKAPFDLMQGLLGTRQRCGRGTSLTQEIRVGGFLGGFDFDPFDLFFHFGISVSFKASKIPGMDDIINWIWISEIRGVIRALIGALRVTQGFSITFGVFEHPYFDGTIPPYGSCVYSGNLSGKVGLTGVISSSAGFDFFDEVMRKLGELDYKSPSEWFREVLRRA